MAESFLALLENEKPQIQAMLSEQVGKDRWWALMVDVAKSRELQRIAQNNPGSLLAAVKKIADWGIDLDGQEAIIIPYGDEAVPQAMYQGLIRRAVEAGAISHAVADIIKEGDDVEISSGTQGRTLTHRPKFNLKGGKRQIVGAYALITMPNGGVDYELFDMDDIDRVKRAAERMAKRRKADAGLSPAWREFEGEMVKKSVLRRALKRFRGRRDTEAGRKLSDMLSVNTHFDAETTGETLPPDNIPDDDSGVVQAGKTAGLEPANAGSNSAPGLKLVADGANKPKGEDGHREHPQEAGEDRSSSTASSATLTAQDQTRVLSLMHRKSIDPAVLDDILRKPPFNQESAEFPDISLVQRSDLKELLTALGEGE